MTRVNDCGKRAMALSINGATAQWSLLDSIGSKDVGSLS